MGYSLAQFAEGCHRILTDDPAAIQDEPMYSFQQVSVPGKGNQILRQYHDLARFEPAPPPAPSTQAVDDDPKKADAPGNQPKQDNPAK